MRTKPLSAATTINPRNWHAIVRLGADDIAVPLDAVREIAHPPAVTRVPGVPTFVLGVAECNGALATVVDPQLLLGGAAWRRSREARALVFAGDEPLCIVVDALRGVGAACDDPASGNEPAHALESIARGWTLVAGAVVPLPVLDHTLLLRRLGRELALAATSAEDETP